MPLPPPIVVPVFPDVPPVPGVPPLLRQFGAPFPPPIAAGGDGPGVPASAPTQTWGIYLDGAPAVTSDTVDDFEFRQDFRISTAPQEQGAFMSYNKVADPFDGKVSFIVGGTVERRTAMLAQIAAAISSISTGYSLVMPERTFASVNVTHQGFRRTARAGVTMLVVDVWVEEVRVTGTAQFSNTVNPEAAATQNGGTVQAQPPTPAQGTAVSNTALSGSNPPAPAYEPGG